MLHIKLRSFDMRSLAFFTALCTALLTLPAFAELTQARLKAGMSFNEVIAVKGAPLEKDEHETSRVAIWRYKDESVRFYDGKLEIASPIVAVPVVAQPKSEKAVVAAPSKGVSSKKRDKISQKVVDEIFDALPNDTSPAQPASPVMPEPVRSLADE